MDLIFKTSFFIDLRTSLQSTNHADFIFRFIFEHEFCNTPNSLRMFRFSLKNELFSRSQSPADFILFFVHSLWNIQYFIDPRPQLQISFFAMFWKIHPLIYNCDFKRWKKKVEKKMEKSWKWTLKFWKPWICKDEKKTSTSPFTYCCKWFRNWIPFNHTSVSQIQQL